MRANNLSDKEHLGAIEFAIQNYEYNMALFRWQGHRRRSVPKPEAFGLQSDAMAKKDAMAERGLSVVNERIISKA